MRNNNYKITNKKPRGLIILGAFLFLVQIAYAYTDTTPDNFPKPKPIETKAYHYEESKYDKAMDQVADKVGSGVLGNVIGGPAGLLIRVGDKFTKIKEHTSK